MMNRRGSRWFVFLTVCGLFWSTAGCGSNSNVDPVVAPKENQKDQPQIKPATRGAPQSSGNLDPQNNKQK